MEMLNNDCVLYLLDFLDEKDRRRLKRVSKFFNEMYKEFARRRKLNPPRTIKRCTKNCNVYTARKNRFGGWIFGPVFHNCICVYRKLVGWERY